MSGTMIEMKAPADSRYHGRPRVPARLASAHGHRRDVGVPPANVSATSRSFQTQRNWKMPNAASAGVSSGSMHPEEDLDVPGAVDPGGLDELRAGSPA